MNITEWIINRKELDNEQIDCAAADWARYYSNSGCTCFKCAPCASCLHEGNPNNLKQMREDMKINRANFAEFFRNDYYTVAVRFMDGAGDKDYTYKVPKSIGVTFGSKVIVCVPNDPTLAKELKIVTVVRVDENPQVHDDAGFNYKWIIGTFDTVMEEYLANVAKDTKLKTAVAKLEQKLEQISLRKQLQLAMDELDDESKAELSQLFGTELLIENKTDAKAIT